MHGGVEVVIVEEEGSGAEEAALDVKRQVVVNVNDKIEAFVEALVLKDVVMMVEEQLVVVN